MLRRSAWLANALAAAGILLVNAALNGPLFLPGEMPYRDSIEGGYASITRFFAAQPDPWGWNPTAYCGLPAQSTYLPGLPYAAAALTWLAPGLEPTYAHRLVTAVLACLGPVSVFFFVLYFTRSRRWALAAALVCTLFSPAYGLFRTIDKDRGMVQLPWRIQVLAKYGEGPHNAGLTLLPLAVVALWAAATGRKRRQILAAALLLAAIALTNWVAALAAALCAGTLLLALGFEKEARARVWTVAGAGVLAYLLACFWLTPSLVRTTALNWPKDSFNYQLAAPQVWLLAGLFAALLALRALLARMKVEAYRSFVTLAAFGFGWIVVIYYSFGVSTIPESRRYAVEFELFLLLALVEWLRWALRHPNSMLPCYAMLCTAVMLLAGAGQAIRYVTQGHARWRSFPKEQSIEYRCARALVERTPAGRIFASGGLRFRLNSWFELPQVGGTYESGLTNRLPIHMAYQIRTGIGSAPGQEGQDAVLQLKALGVEYVVVHGPKSKEHFRDVRNPQKFEGLLESVYREGDDVIYRVPFRSLAHLARASELPERPPRGHDRQFLRPYVAALEDASRPRLLTRWSGPNRLLIEGPVPEGMLVSVQVSYHPGWTAWQDGQPLRIEPDQLGFMVLRARSAAFSRIEMRYRGTFEQRAAAFVSAVTLLAGLAWAVRRRRPT